jgi:hypothetical protein
LKFNLLKKGRPVGNFEVVEVPWQPGENFHLEEISPLSCPFWEQVFLGQVRNQKIQRKKSCSALPTDG